MKNAEENQGIKINAKKGRVPMATRKRQSHNLGTSIGGSIGNAQRKRWGGRQAISGKTGRSPDRNRRGSSKVNGLKYSMLIQWSDEDETYIVTLPEFDNAKTHGDTYEKAARMGRDLIESFIMWSQQDGKPLPAPHKFVFEDAHAIA